MLSKHWMPQLVTTASFYSAAGGAVARSKHGRLRCIDSAHRPRIQTASNRPYRRVKEITQVLRTLG